jgi:hypothetical protein
VTGRVGALVPFTSHKDVELFTQLEGYLQTDAPRPAEQDPQAYRSYYAPVMHVVDGDLCDVFNGLSHKQQVKIAERLDRAVGEIIKKTGSHSKLSSLKKVFIVRVHPLCVHGYLQAGLLHFLQTALLGCFRSLSSQSWSSLESEEEEDEVLIAAEAIFLSENEVLLVCQQFMLKGYFLSCTTQLGIVVPLGSPEAVFVLAPRYPFLEALWVAHQPACLCAASPHVRARVAL